MANRAYLRVWTRDFSMETMIAEFARFLASVPLSESHAGFDQLTVQAVDVTETPVVEWDMREQNYGAAEVAALAAQQLYADVAYIVNARWDLWAFDVETLKWQHGPQPLVILCQGEDFDSGAAESEGQLSADLGFEHLFTGHAGMLAPGAASDLFAGSDHPIEKTFRNWMASGENLKEYHQKTRENIRKLFAWMEAVEHALPVQRSELWSEGEENFEARLDAILGQR